MLAGHEAGGIKGMDRHVEQQDIVHGFTKAAEMRGDEEVAVDARDVADQSVIHGATQAPDARDEAAVLDDGMHPSRFCRERKQCLRLIHGGGKRLFGEDMAAKLERGRNDGEARRRHDHVKQHIGLRCLDDGSEVRVDHHALKTKFGCKRFRHRKIEVDETDDLDIAAKVRSRLKRSEPAFGHSSAPAQNGP